MQYRKGRYSRVLQAGGNYHPYDPKTREPQQEAKTTIPQPFRVLVHHNGTRVCIDRLTPSLSPKERLRTLLHVQRVARESLRGRAIPKAQGSTPQGEGGALCLEIRCGNAQCKWLRPRAEDFGGKRRSSKKFPVQSIRGTMNKGAVVRPAEAAPLS